jgi:hypothetical protein
MKNLKIVLWLILVGITALIVFQNWEFFSLKKSLMVNVYLAPHYNTPELPYAVWFFACFFIGLLIAYFFSLMERFKSRKTIKELNAKTDSLLEMISQLRKELESRRSAEVERPSVKPETVVVSSTASE